MATAPGPEAPAPPSPGPVPAPPPGPIPQPGPPDHAYDPLSRGGARSGSSAPPIEFSPTAVPPPASAVPVGPPPGAPGSPFPYEPQGGFSTDPHQPAPKADKAPFVVLLVSALVVLGLVAGGAYIVTSGGKQFPSEWDERVAPLAAWAARERNLEFEHAVEVHFLSEEEFTANVTGADLVLSDEDQAEMDEMVADQLATLRALGFVTGDVDLEEAANSVTGAGTLAYYDTGTKEVFVRGSELTPAVRATLVHELVHVLQDQHFDLGRIAEMTDSNQSSTLRAMAEGDAGRIEDRYLETLSEADRETYDQEYASTAESYEEAVGEDVPPVLEIMFAAPYVLGPDLVSYLEETGGDEAIDAALLDPPTEFTLFDPRIQGTDRDRMLPAEVTVPADAELMEEDTFGAVWWYLLLAARIEPAQALGVVQGIGGDAYVSFRSDRGVCVRIAAVTHTDDEARALAEALEEWASFTPEAAVTSQEGKRVELQSCDEERDEPVGEIRIELLALPSLRTVIHLQTLAEGADHEEARCFSEGIINSFTMDELLTGDTLSEPSALNIIRGVRIGCG